MQRSTESLLRHAQAAKHRRRVTDAGKVQGRFHGTGIAPRVLDRLRVGGIQLPPSVFEDTLAVNL